MSDNLSTQLPTPPELQPLAPRTKVWPVISYLLIIAGVVFLGWGAWNIFQNWYQISNPPARIVEAVPAVTDTPTASPPAVAAATTTEPATPVSTATPTPFPATATSRPVGDTIAVDTPTPATTPTPQATEPPVTAPPNTPVLDTPDTPETAPSLEEYPLVVETSPENEPPSTEASAPNPDNYLTRITAESIQLDAPVVTVGWQKTADNVNVWTVAEYAAGWHKNSALPGQGGNIVLSGHHNIKGEVFRYIVDLEPGAVISLYGADNQRYDYTVFDKFIVKDKGEPEEVRLANARWIGPFNEERLTLVTCWPYNNNTHRVIVIAKPLQTEPGSEGGGS